jgi:hypothetical protein
MHCAVEPFAAPRPDARRPIGQSPQPDAVRHIGFLVRLVVRRRYACSTTNTGVVGQDRVSTTRSVLSAPRLGCKAARLRRAIVARMEIDFWHSGDRGRVTVTCVSNDNSACASERPNQDKRASVFLRTLRH